MNFFEARDRFRQELAEGVALFADEADWNDKWRYADQHIYPHASSPEKHTLEPILGVGVSLQSLVDQRRLNGQSTHVLELFGSAHFLADPLAADSLTGVRLKDTVYENDPERHRTRLPHHEVVLGDIYDEDTLRKISDNLTRRNIPAIDITVCAPFLGWGMWEGDYPLNVYLDTYYPLLEWAYRKSNLNKGTILTEFPLGKSETRTVRDWEARMNDAGIPTKVVDGYRGYPVASIVRLPKSPSTVVPLQGRCAPPRVA